MSLLTSPHGLTFGNILRTLLVRIRAIQDSQSQNTWPPSGAAGGDVSLYRVTPTAWGVRRATPPEHQPSPLTVKPAHRQKTTTRRRRVEIPVFQLPVPRGLPST